MRRVRIIVGLAAAACALAVFATPTFAATFGNFAAHISGQTISPGTPAEAKGHGEASEIQLGQYKISCEKEIKSKGKVTAEHSSEFFQEMRFSKCKTLNSGTGPIGESKNVHFKLLMTFKSNGSTEFGPESEVEVAKTEVAFKASGSSCIVTIPQQDVPKGAEKHPEKEWEAASYSTEKEAVEGKRNLEKFPSGFQEKLDISMELKGIHTLVKLTPSCTYKGKEGPGGTEEGKYNPETGDVEFTNGKLEAELEEITIKGGDLGFEAA